MGVEGTGKPRAKQGSMKNNQREKNRIDEKKRGREEEGRARKKYQEREYGPNAETQSKK